MKKFVKIGIGVVILVVLVGAVAAPISAWFKKRSAVEFREDEVVDGDITSVVNSTGTVRPTMSVQIGAFVSGPIDPDVRLVEFNEEVKKGQLLAKIDPRIYVADVQRDLAAVDAAEAQEAAAKAGVEAALASLDATKAALKTRHAEVGRAEAQLNRAKNDEFRAQTLASERADFVSQAEMDELKYSRMQLEEALNVTKAAIDQAEATILQAKASVSEARASLTRATAGVAQAIANKTRSELNRDYTEITSPVDGIVIDRRIEPGQTLAATFQTPELFVIAPNMREEIHVYASVDEADIGLIREAQENESNVEFTVDAYDDLFEGTIKEVRFSSTTTQNVVTYPVIVSAKNPELKLLPGMTATISFHVEKRENVVRIPNAALRYYPEAHLVREEDQDVLDGASLNNDDDEMDNSRPSAAEKSEEARKRTKRHVWAREGEKLRAIEVTIGISDSKYTQLVSGDLKAGMKLVTGVQSK